LPIEVHDKQGPANKLRPWFRGLICFAQTTRQRRRNPLRDRLANLNAVRPATGYMSHTQAKTSRGPSDKTML